MPLVLSLKNGEDFYVNDSQFQVSYVGQDYSTVVHVLNPKVKKLFTITNTRAREIMHGVMASEGVRKQLLTVRLVLDAPLENVILRGDVYRSKQPGVADA